MSEPYKEELDTLASVFGTPWNPQTLAAVLTHFGGDPERATDSILEHGDGDPNLLVRKLNASRGPANVDAAQNARDYSVGKAHGSGQKPSSKVPEMVVGSNPSPDERARLERRLQMRESAVKAAKTSGKSQDGGPAMMDIYKSAPTMIPSDHLLPEQSVPLKRAKARGGRSALTDKIKAGPEVLPPTNPVPPAPFVDRSSSPSRNSKSSNVEMQSGRSGGGVGSAMRQVGLASEEERVEESPLEGTAAAGVNIWVEEDLSGAAEDGVGTSHEQEEVVPAGRDESAPMVSAVLVPDDRNTHDGSGQARAVDFAVATPLDESDRENIKWNLLLRNRWVLSFLFVVVVAIVGLSLGLALGKGDGGGATASLGTAAYQEDQSTSIIPTISPGGPSIPSISRPVPSSTGSPTGSPIREPMPTSSPEDLQELFCSAFPTSCLALSDQSSPQYAALTWLQSDPDLASISTTRKFQRYALATFYYSTKGWSDGMFWLSGDECDWEGITCGNGGVTRLRIEDNLSGGTIPKELALLKDSLDYIYLGWNDLSGTLPSELGELENLVNLGLRKNKLSGTLPKELGRLTNLVDLGIWDNNFSGTLPSELGQLRKLEELELRWNRLSGTIPPVIGQLTNLKKITFSSNEISGTIPTQIGMLSSLKWLYGFDNKLSGSIPSEFGRLASLGYLDLQDNILTGTVPDQICRLTNLVTFELDCISEITCDCCTSCQ